MVSSKPEVLARFRVVSACTKLLTSAAETRRAQNEKKQQIEVSPKTSVRSKRERHPPIQFSNPKEEISATVSNKKTKNSKKQSKKEQEAAIAAIVDRLLSEHSKSDSTTPSSLCDCSC